ncbi:MAG: Gfo/Idh/MocA family oxidoreductase [Treponema sp.]|nr:Gfo/Idh/MocA family oxidoreductase [Treponema sp.]
MSRPVKAAIIGAGMISNKAHIPAYLSKAGSIQIAGIFDPNPKAAKSTAERFNIPSYYIDAEKMLAELKPDLVSVCSPNAYHKTMTELALNHGANVLCEKPIALTYTDTKEMFDLAAKKNLTLLACQTMRYSDEIQAAHELAEQGLLGDIYFSELNMIRRRGVPKWGSFHLRSANGGGAFCDLGVHMIDTALWIMGNPAFQSISGFSADHITRNERNIITSLTESGTPSSVNLPRPYKPEEFEVEEFAAGSLRLNNGASINFKISWALNLPPEFHLSFAGTKAGLRLPELELYSTLGRYQADIKPRIFREGPYSNADFAGHYHLIGELIDYLNGKGSIPVCKEETLNVAAIIDAFYLSAERKCEVQAKEITG